MYDLGTKQIPQMDVDRSFEKGLLPGKTAVVKSRRDVIGFEGF